MANELSKQTKLDLRYLNGNAAWLKTAIANADR